MKLPLAIVDIVSETIKKYATKPFLFGYRISPEEIEEPGIRFEDTLALIDELKKRPIDYLHVSMGTVHRTSLNNKNETTWVSFTFLTYLTMRWAQHPCAHRLAIKNC